MPINLCLMTFTEGSTGCYVSSREFEGLDIPLAVEHVDSWKLGVPPDHPNISACGDDGAENQKAALEKLKDLSPLPTLLFLITDAPPHMAADSATPTSRAEMRWLQERGVSDLVAGDVFRLFDSVLDHYDRENLIFNGVVFSGQAQSGVYASMARRTGGLLMEPTSRSPITLASGLMTVVKALLSQLPGALPANNNTGTTAAVPPGEITGYNLYDVSHVALRETESDPAGSPPVVGDNIEIFRIAMDRIVEVCGRKWTKRAIGMSAAAEQLEFVWRTARFVVGHESEGRGELSYLLKLREKILQELPAEVRGHFSIDERDIEGLARLGVSSRGDNEEWGDLGAGISAISLQTVGEALAEDAEWTDWLATIMALLTGFPMQLQLPKDRMGKPDFADAWSAVTLALGVDRMSASDFMQLLSAEGGGAMTGPTDRHAGYNAFLTLPHPSDAAAAIVYKIASGTQVRVRERIDLNSPSCFDLTLFCNYTIHAGSQLCYWSGNGSKRIPPKPCSWLRGRLSHASSLLPHPPLLLPTGSSAADCTLAPLVAPHPCSCSTEAAGKRYSKPVRLDLKARHSSRPSLKSQIGISGR